MHCYTRLLLALVLLSAPAAHAQVGRDIVERGSNRAQWIPPSASFFAPSTIASFGAPPPRTAAAAALPRVPMSPGVPSSTSTQASSRTTSSTPVVGSDTAAAFGILIEGGSRNRLDPAAHARSGAAA